MQLARPDKRWWLTSLAPPVLALTSFALAYWLDPLGLSGTDVAPALPAFFLSVVVLLIGQIILAATDLFRASFLSSQIYEAVKGYLHVTPVGSPEEALRYIYDRLPALREIQNTSFSVDEETERAEEKLYDTDLYSRIGDEIRQGCRGGLLWKDIGDAHAVTRLREISAKNKYNSRKSSGYKFRLISHNEPQINFITLEYRDGIKEVLFNWDFRTRGSDPVVLLSRDERIVDMFHVHFQMLWSCASPDHDNQATRSTSTK